MLTLLTVADASQPQSILSGTRPLSSLHIILAQTEQQYTAAQYFVLPYEQHCCSLMQKIIAREEKLYLITEQNRICGVFYFSQGGTLLPCLPRTSRELADMLQQFFHKKHIFCINGKSDYVTFLNKLLTDNEEHELADTRFYYLMEHEYQIHRNLPPAHTLEQCTTTKADVLFPMHLSYLMEEVRSPVSTPDPIEERNVLKNILHTQHAIAIFKNGSPVAKAHTNAQGVNYVQIGGVYTEKQSRRQGFAGMLVSNIAEWAQQHNKKTVLFVDKYNSTALHAYENAGFTIQDNFIISYFV